jgi:hypothetical protein
MVGCALRDHWVGWHRLRVSRFASVVRWAAELRAGSTARDWLAEDDCPGSPAGCLTFDEC